MRGSGWRVAGQEAGALAGRVVFAVRLWLRDGEGMVSLPPAALQHFCNNRQDAWEILTRQKASEGNRGLYFLEPCIFSHFQ